MKKKKQNKKTIPINFKVDPERDALKQRKQDMEVASAIYQSWKEEFIGHRKAPDQIAEAINVLAGRLEKAIKTPDLKEYLVKVLIDPLIARAHIAGQVMLDTVEVVVDCPNKIKVNNIESPCGWGGLARPSKKTWANKTTSMTCPQCGSILTQDDMALKSDVMAMQRKMKKRGKE